jgi:hypothetical protein
MMAPQAALAQAVPRPVCVSAVTTDAGGVQAMGALADGTLIAAANGLYLAREAGGAIAVSALTGDADTGRVFALHDLPGTGLLIGTENGLFVGRAANGELALARAGDVGRVVQMLEFPHGGALIEAAKGWFLARVESGKVTLLPVVTVAPVTPGDIGHLRSMRSVPGGGVLIEANVWFMAREEGGKLTLALAGDAATGVVDAIGDWPGGQLLIHTEQNGGWQARGQARRQCRNRARVPDEAARDRHAGLGPQRIVLRTRAGRQGHARAGRRRRHRAGVPDA